MANSYDWEDSELRELIEARSDVEPSEVDAYLEAFNQMPLGDMSPNMVQHAIDFIQVDMMAAAEDWDWQDFYDEMFDNFWDWFRESYGEAYS